MSELRIPPHSTEAERGVLGSCLLDPDSIEKCKEIGIKTEDFYDRRHQRLLEHLYGMDSRRLDAILIAQILKDKGALDAVGGYDYLIQLQDSTLVSAHLKFYADIVMEKARARRVIESCSETIEVAYRGEDPDMEAVRHIERMEAILPAPVETMETVIDGAHQEIKDIASGKAVFLPYPWADFQRRTFGLPIRAVTPLLGRDGVCKSRLVMAIVKHWLECDIGVLVFAFEDGKRRYLHALGATFGHYDAFRMNYDPNPIYMQQVEREMEAMKSRPIFVVDDSMTAEDIVSCIASHKRRYGIRAVVIDGFKDIATSGSESKTNEESRTFETVKKGAMRHDVGVLQIEHTHDVEDGKWLSKRNIRGSKQRSQSARSFLVLQDQGFPKWLLDKHGLVGGDGCLALDCQKASYGDKGIVMLEPDLRNGTFHEVRRDG